MTPPYLSGLWNAVDSLIAFWQGELQEGLETNEPPDGDFWRAMADDMESVQALIRKARVR